MVGKLIDNKVNPEDLTSLIYYFANEGYLNISFSDPDDPMFIKAADDLPEDAPSYQKLMFNKIFQIKSHVKASELAGSFVETTQEITAMVNIQAKGIYTGNSMVCALLFAIAAGALLAIGPLIMGLIEINKKFVMLPPFLMIIPVLITYGWGESLKFYRYKTTTNARIAGYIGLILFYLLCSAIYVFFVPNYLFNYLQKTLLALESGLIVFASPSLISPSNDYAKLLADLLGFRLHIVSIKSTDLGKIIARDPQEYYRLVPYAKVLGVSLNSELDNVTMPTPHWAQDLSTDALTYFVICNALNHSANKISYHLMKPPANSSTYHGRRGSFGGGSHGGGGGHSSFRGR